MKTSSPVRSQLIALGPPPAAARAARVGLNFGAPGDRVSEDGTLWLDCPDVGGPSTQIKVEMTPAKPNPQRAWMGDWRKRIVNQPGFGGKVLYRHISAIKDGPLPWVTSSGLDGATSVKVTLAAGAADTAKYTVRLYFAELDDLKAGQRVFSVSLQGKEVLSGFDIAQAAGGAGRGIVKEFKDIAVGETLIVRADQNWTPNQVRDVQEYADTVSGYRDLGVKILFLPGEEFAVATQAGALDGQEESR